MRVIVTGGGTGGHIYPALAIADKIKEKQPDAEILYIGNKDGLEQEIVPKHGYRIKTVSSRNLERSLIGLTKTGISTFKGILECNRIMKSFKPDVVIGTGGFVCFPVMYSASKYGAECYLHEQNAYPGKANRALERFVEKVFLGFAEASPYFRHPQKHVYTGNPVRKSFFKVDKKAARESISIKDDEFLLVAFGGSWGAKVLNDEVYRLARKYSGIEGITLVFATGNVYEAYFKELVEEGGVNLGDNIRILPYIDDMPNYLGAADLLITRAGALSIAEASVCSKASVLVPFPKATGNHQYFNAKAVADRGGAVLIEEKDLTCEAMDQVVKAFMENPLALKTMEEKSGRCSSGDATEIIYRSIFEDK